MGPILLLVPRFIVVPAVCVVWFGWLAVQLSQGNFGQISAIVICGLIGLAGVVLYSLSGFGREDPE